MLEDCDAEIESRNSLLAKSLIDFFKNEDHIKQLLLIVNSEVKGISLRVLDTFVTKTSKYSKNFFYKKKDNEIFRIHNSYRSQLKAYSKKQFDPFNRGKRIKLFYNQNKNVLITTIGQLNFFRWAIENELIEYLTGNLKKQETCDFSVSFN